MPLMTRSTFPVKLHVCLIELEREEQSHIASFQPHGRALMVHNQHDFLAVLPRWFNMTKIESFQRQLNIYGFQRITKGPDKHAYYHPLFQRDHAVLAALIPHQGTKGAGPRQAVECCPDFSVAPNLTENALVTQGGNVERSEPPSLMQPSIDQLILHRIEPQQSGDTVTASSLPVSQRVPPPQMQSVSSSMAHGAPWTDHPVMGTSLARPMDLHWHPRLQQQQQQTKDLELYLRQLQRQELEQLRDEQQMEYFLAVAAPPLPSVTDVLLHAALGQPQRERDYPALSFQAATTQERDRAQCVNVSPLERFVASNSFVPPARLDRQQGMGVDHALLILLRGRFDASGDGPSRHGNVGQFGPN